MVKKKKKRVEEFSSAVSFDFSQKDGTKVRMRITPTDEGYHQSIICLPRLRRKFQVSCKCSGGGQVSIAEGSCSDPYSNFCSCVNGRAVITCDGKKIEGSDPKPEFEGNPGTTHNP